MTSNSPTVFRRFTDLAHGQIHYREAGRPGGDVLVLIHGSPGSSAQLTHMMALLAPDAHIIAPDTAGFGDSDALQLNKLSGKYAASCASQLPTAKIALREN